MTNFNKNACFLAILLSVGMLTACQKPADNNSSADNASKDQTTAAQSTQSQNAEGEHGEHDHEHHEGDGHDHDGHDHEHHEHDGHDHHHGDGTHYDCDNNQAVDIAIHNHDGEIEAQATIDDILYDLPQDPKNPNHYLSPEGLNNDGLLLILEGNTATFKTPDGKTTHFSCQAHG